MSNVQKRYLWIGGVLGLIVLALIFGAVRPYKHAMGAPPSTPDVEVTQVQMEDVPIYGDWIGTLDGLVNADVRAQVTGYLLKQGYQEGAFVKQGQLLFQIDPRPFEAALDQAQGQLAQAKASLANAEAVQHRTELDVQRYKPLAEQQAASQQDLDNAVQNNLAAIGMIQGMGLVGTALLPDLKVPMIATRDVGDYAAQRLLHLDFSGKQTRELLGERDLSITEATAVIARGIGKPELRYEQLTYDQLRQALTQMGFSPKKAAVYIEMFTSVNTGVLAAQEPRSRENTTPTSFEQFVQDVFVPAYHGKASAA